MNSTSSDQYYRIKRSTNNSRVASIPAESIEKASANRIDCRERVIERCYRQIFFHAMTADRECCLESQFKTGSITVRDFVRGLLLSERFYRGYVACNNNNRVVEQVVGRLLGRTVDSQEELQFLAIMIGEKGFTSLVDWLLDSPEYMNRYGYDAVPEQVNRLLPGRVIGEIPIYQKLPRYGESWRDRLVRDGMMLSISAFNTIGNPSQVYRLIYEKPTGRALIGWTLFLLFLGITTAATSLTIIKSTFTIR